MIRKGQVIGLRAITAVAVAFVLLVGLAVAAYSYIDTSAHQLVGEFNKVEGAINQGQWALAKDQLVLARAKWEQTKPVWTVLLNHREIDNIDVALARVEKYAESSAVSFSLGELASLRLLVTHIADTEYPTLANIL